MFCQECHRQVPTNSRYCQYCGVRLSLPYNDRPAAVAESFWDRDWQTDSPARPLQAETLAAPVTLTSEELTRPPRRHRAIIGTLALTCIVGLGISLALLHTPVFAALNLPDITLPLQQPAPPPTVVPAATPMPTQPRLIILQP